MTSASRRAVALWQTLAAVAPRPRLWPIAAAVGLRLAPRGWWRRFPFLPVPTAAYWGFRMHTAFGAEPEGRPTRQDSVEFLEWCRRTRGWRRAGTRSPESPKTHR